MARFEHAPIERHEAIAPLSRDHYVGLVQARHLIRAADKDVVTRRKVVAEFVDAWDREIVGHFRDEEELLCDFLGEADLARLVEEHGMLSSLAGNVRALRQQVDPDARTLRAMGEALDDHIRWEERELFNRLQTAMTVEQLASLQVRTAPLEAARARSICRTPTNESPES